jgi:hypothetical protein
MSLPASQQRALDAIDTDLRAADIRLASMFTVFTELTQLEKMPVTETFQPVRWWTRAIVLVPLLLAATLSLLLLSVLTTRAASSGRCAQAGSFIAPVRLAANGGCAPGGGQPRTGPAGG